MAKQEKSTPVFNTLEKLFENLIPENSYRDISGNLTNEAVYQPSYGKSSLVQIMGKMIGFSRQMFDADKYFEKLKSFIRKNGLEYHDPDDEPPKAAFYTKSQLEEQQRLREKEKQRKNNNSGIGLGYEVGTNRLSYGYLTDDGMIMPLRRVQA